MVFKGWDETAYRMGKEKKGFKDCALTHWNEEKSGNVEESTTILGRNDQKGRTTREIP